MDIADGAGKRLTGTVTAVAPGELTVECVDLAEEPRPGIRLVLVQALAKGDRDELAAETATELGIDAVIPWQAERSIVRWKAERAAKAHAKWQSVVTAAAKQARRAWIPEVRAAVDGAGLQAAVAAADLAVILHEDAVRPLRQVLETWLEVLNRGDARRRPEPVRDPADRGSGRRNQPAGGDPAVRRRGGHGPAGTPRAALVHRGPAATVLASDILGRW